MHAKAHILLEAVANGALFRLQIVERQVWHSFLQFH